MAYLNITIDLENSAFDGNREGEVSELFDVVLARLEIGANGGMLQDSSGNTCGLWHIRAKPGIGYAELTA